MESSAVRGDRHHGVMGYRDDPYDVTSRSLREVVHHEPAQVREPIPAAEPVGIESASAAAARRLLDARGREARERRRLLSGVVVVREAEDDGADGEDTEEGDEGTPVETVAEAHAPRRSVRSQTVNLGRVSLRERRRLALLQPEETYWRPKTRADCASVPRPCPYVACRHHLLLDVTETGTSLKLNFPDVVEDRVHRGPLREDGGFFRDGADRVVEGPFLEEMDETCGLDVADRGASTHEELSALFNLSRERVRQVEDQVFEALRQRRPVREMGELLDLRLEREAFEAAAVLPPTVPEALPIVVEVIELPVPLVLAPVLPRPRLMPWRRPRQAHRARACLSGQLHLFHGVHALEAAAAE